MQKEIKEKKIVDQAIIEKMKERIDEMAAEQLKYFEEKVNSIKINYSFSENAKDNFKKNLNLFQLNEQHVQGIFGEQSKELSEEEKQKEIKRRKTVKKEKLAEINQKLDTMIQTLEETHNRRRRDSIKNSSMAEKVE